jgi:hypothetical protein
MDAYTLSAIPVKSGFATASCEKALFSSLGSVYNAIYLVVNGTIYMNFRQAVDALCACLSHEDVAKALGVSLQTVRQARLSEDSPAFRAAQKNWKKAIIRLAEARVSHYRKLIEKLKATTEC